LACHAAIKWGKSHSEGLVKPLMRSVHTPIHATWKSSLPWVHLQLIPRHIGILGSEKGEALAKIATNKPQPAVNMMLTSAKNSDTVAKKSLPSL
jgi:hypothetical protein